ncbi:MAG: YceI family protein [Bacteroidota bacterium]
MSATSTTTKWAIDPTHSEVHFKVKHLVISTVTGSFKAFSGNATFDNDNLENANINFSIDPASIDTNQEQRDGHLKSPDFFDVANHPAITFKSNSLKHIKGDNYKLTGDLTVRGVTKQVEVDAEYGGTAKDGYGNTKMGFEVTGVIHRKDFGLTWNSVTEAGGVVVGEDIKLSANIQLVQQAN